MSPTPAIAETVTLQITSPPTPSPATASCGWKRPGLTNPLVFCVGQLPEFSTPKKDGYASLQPPTTQQPDMRRSRCRRSSTARSCPAASIAIRFQARKGQRLVVAAGARELIP